MIKKILLSAFILATASSQALAMKNYEIQTNTFGTEYTFWCDDGQVINFSIGHNMEVSMTLKYDTIDEYLASRNCF